MTNEVTERSSGREHCQGVIYIAQKVEDEESNGDVGTGR